MAFGDKRALFTKVVTAYGRTYGAFALRALEEEPTATAGVARISVRQRASTRHPAGPTAAC